MTAGLGRLRAAYIDWDDGGDADEGYLARFAEQINADLNMPRALALAWELTRSDLPTATKKATMDAFDRVLAWVPGV